MTLRRRLYVVAAALLTVLTVAGVLLIRSVESTQIAQVDQQIGSAYPLVVSIAQVNHQVSSDLSVAKGNSRAFVGAPPVEVESKAISDLYVASVKGARRSTIVSSLDASGQSPQTPRVASAPPARNFRFVTVNSRVGSGPWRAVLVAAGGPNQVLLARSLVQADGTVTDVRLAVIGAGLLALLVLLAAGFWVGRLGLRPIAQVTQAADGIAAGDRTRRVNIIRPGTEAGHLARAFNVMLDEQQGIKERLRQFVADASHELRTPLSVIQGLTGLWRQGELRSGDAHDDAMRRIGQDSARMARLVGDLLLLARLDEGRPFDRSTIDLEPLVRAAVLDVSETHPSRTITFEADPRVETDGDEVALRQVVINLVMNAVTHTPPTATVAVHVSGRSGQVVLAVTDTGPGMDAESVDHAFDRFWRADASRTRAGSGLGLSIVAGIVTAHGGVVRLDSDPVRGTVVEVVLPASELVSRTVLPRPVGRLAAAPASARSRRIWLPRRPEIVSSTGVSSPPCEVAASQTQ
jgi:two-component system OmpR family sensor kinase